MNKPFLKFSAFVLAGAMLVACGSDDDASKSNEEENGAEFPTEYADLSVEENKSNLEDNGIEFANSVEALKNSSGIETSIAFANFSSDGDLAVGRKSSLPIFDLVNNLKDFGRSNKPLDKTLAGMRTSEDIESIQTEFNNVAGTYTYNSQEQVWDSVPAAGSGKIVFKFPSKENGTTNNAEYTIYDYKGVNVSNSAVSENYAGEYPAGLKIDLTIDGQKKLEYTFAASYNSKGEPTSLTISVKVDAFVLAYEVSNDGAKASVKYSLKQNDKNLYVLGADAEGNFNTDSIEQSSGGDDVISKGTIYFQIMNIKFSGEIDVDALMTAIKAIPEQDDKEEEAAEAAAYNANSTMVIFYADSKKKIAEGEVVAVTKTETYTYRDCEWNDEIQDYICEDKQYTEEHNTKDLQLVFADESRMSIETFVESGFGELTDKLEELLGEE